MAAKKLLAIILIFFCSNALAERQYSFGVVPQYDTRRIVNIWSPILKEISSRTGIKLKLVPSKHIPEFEKQFESGKFDFAYMNPYHAIVANKKQGYRPIVRDIEKILFGIIVVHKDSKITKINELHKRKIAMPAPNALGAALLPRAEFATVFKIAPKIEYVNSHDSVYLNVLLGVSQAGGGVMRTLKQQTPDIQDQLRILYKTQGVAAHPIVAHKNLPENLIKQVQESFITLGKSPKNRALLKKIPISRIGEANLKDYLPLVKLGLHNFYVKNSK